MIVTNLEFITNRNEILSLLSRSRHHGLAIGINSDALGTGTYVSCVEGLSIEDEIIVYLKPYDATGKMLQSAKLKLSEITSVLAFSSVFQNPYHKTTQFTSSKLG